MSWSVQKITATTIILATAVILYFGAMSYQSTRNVVQTARVITHTHEILTSFQLLQTTAGEATTVVRDYLANGDESRVQAYTAAKGRITGILQHVRELTADDSRRQQQITILEQTINERFARAEDAMRRRRDEGAAAASVGGTGGSQAIREQIAVMAREEEERLQNRTKDEETDSQRMILLNAIFLLLSLAFLGAFFYRIQRDFAARQRAEEALRDSEERHRALFDSSPNPMWVYDLENLTFLAMNDAAVRHYGYSRDEFSRMTGRDIRPPEDVPLLLERAAQTTPGTNTIWPARHRKKEGTIIQVEASVHALMFGGRRAALLSINDVTERLQTEENLRQTHANLEASLEELAQREKDITRLNEMGDTLQSCQTPAEAHEVISQCLPQICPGCGGAVYILSASRNVLEAVALWGGSQPEETTFSPDDCWGLRRGRIHIFQQGGTTPRCKHSNAKSAGTICIPMMAQSDAMGVLCLEADQDAASKTGCTDYFLPSQQRLARTAAEQIALALGNLKLRETLRNQSIRDPLTDLFNRRYMEESLERELRRAARKHTALALAMLDIDNFKEFNDSFGHEAGDAMLRLLATHLHNSIRFEDIACRYGGEEFVLILPDSGLEDTVRHMEELREGAHRLRLELHKRTVGNLSLSLGIAVFPTHGADSETLLRIADQALYRAKQLGRDRVVVGEVAPATVVSGTPTA